VVHVTGSLAEKAEFISNPAGILGRCGDVACGRGEWSFLKQSNRQSLTCAFAFQYLERQYLHVMIRIPMG